MSVAENKAVFLSYASQDAETAKRICESLRQAGVEVWFDQSEPLDPLGTHGLVGGDAWDAKIRGQIKSCALFVPVISAATQARREGYFRIEWKLAAQRSHAFADGTPFLLPVVIDDTRDAEALVPEEFRAVQWTRLPGGEASATFCARVKALLESGTGVPPVRTATDPDQGQDAHATTNRRAPRRWLVPALIGLAASATLVLWHPWRHMETAASPLPPASSAALSPARALAAKARALFERLDATRDDYALAEDWLKQAAAKDPNDAEVCAATAQLLALYNLRGFDVSDARREAARAAAQRAARLDPSSFEARFAQLMLLSDADPAAREPKERGLRELHGERPHDQRVLRTLAEMLDRNDRLDEAIPLQNESAALPGGDPLALYNQAWGCWFAGRAEAAEAALQASLAQRPFSSSLLARAYFALLLHGDLEGARRAIEQVPPAALAEDRGAVTAFLVYFWRREPEAALASLARVPRDWFDDSFYRGPKAELSGDVLASAGRADAAAVEWRAALKLVEAQVETNSNRAALLRHRAYLLAALDEPEKAAEALRAWEQITGATYTARSPMSRALVEVYLKLGRRREVIEQLRLILASPNWLAAHMTLDRLKLEPTWDPLRAEPEFAKLLAPYPAPGAAPKK
ncbi:MAG TPA: toll/interleukin-1 receptor domain-containing protein [Opitutaceae bacterium]|nr:toll/interleukin-1 receptor domain-containing protein [Opitutaceae bacterium]